MLFSILVGNDVKLRTVFDHGVLPFYPEHMTGDARIISPLTPEERGRVFGGPNREKVVVAPHPSTYPSYALQSWLYGPGRHFLTSFHPEGPLERDFNSAQLLTMGEVMGGDGWEYYLDWRQDLWLGNPEFFHDVVKWHSAQGWPFAALWRPLRTVPEDHEQENASYINPLYDGFPAPYRPAVWRTFSDAWEDFNHEVARAYDVDTLGGLYSGELTSCYAVPGTSLTQPYLELMRVHCIMLQRRETQWENLASPDRLGDVAPVPAAPELPQDVDPRDLAARPLWEIPSHMRLALEDVGAGQARQVTTGQATV